jgi:hypothetical protein
VIIWCNLFIMAFSVEVDTYTHEQSRGADLAGDVLAAGIGSACGALAINEFVLIPVNHPAERAMHRQAWDQIPEATADLTTANLALSNAQTNKVADTSMLQSRIDQATTKLTTLQKLDEPYQAIEYPSDAISAGTGFVFGALIAAGRYGVRKMFGRTGSLQDAK